MNLFDSWKEAKLSQEQIASFKTEVEYKTATMKGKRDLIVQACSFWEFVRVNVPVRDMDVRRRFLTEFVNDENPFVATVAIVESLPDSVWRRILWRHNVDFLSFESFLRRITSEQSEALRNNFDDLFIRRVIPRIFKRREKKKFSVEGLMKEGIYREKRYLAKGSWASNLLDIDFGYNAYSNGVYDDNRNVESEQIKSVNLVKGMVKLVTNQTNKNDFVVDTEFGKYFWLYTKARSNYVLSPNKEINLKTHICPGFWYTLIVHLIFWVVSPLSALSYVTLGSILPEAISMPAFVIGAITPLWTLAASVKFVGKRIIPKRALQFVDDWVGDNFDSIRDIFFLVLYVFSPAIVGFGALGLFKVLQVIIGTFAALVSVFTFLVYLGHRFYDRLRYGWWPEILDMPGYIGYMILASVCAALTRTAIVFRSQIWDMVVGIFTMLWQFAYNAGSLMLFLIIPTVIVCLMAYFTFHLDEEKQEKVFLWMEKYLVYISLGTGAILVVIIISSIYQLNQLGIIGGEHFLEKAIALFLILASFVGTSYAAYRMRPTVKKCRRAISRVNSGISDSNDRFSCRAILKNKWLKSLDEEIVVQQLNRMYDALRFSFSRGERHYAYYVILPKVNESVLDMIDNTSHKLRDANWKYHGEHKVDYLCSILVHLIDGKDFDEAERMAKEKIKKEVQMIKVKREKRKSLFAPLTKPFKKMWEYVMTLERLYEDFNKLCPNIFRPRVLDMDADD